MTTTQTYIKKTQRQYIADKVKEVKEKTGLDISEKALDWARKVDGIFGLNEGEKAVATVAFHDYQVRNGEKTTAKDLDAYVKMRQALEMNNAMAYRKRSFMAPS